MEIEKIKEINIIDVAKSYGVQVIADKKCICPFHADINPSMIFNNNHFYCFGCGKKGSVIDFVMEKEKCNVYDACKKLERFKPLETENYNNTPKEKNKYDFYTPEEKIEELQKYCLRCIRQVHLTDYFYKRGLTQETIERFCLGYDAFKKWVVIPYNRKLTYYQCRSVENKVFFKPQKQLAGTEPLFNMGALNLTGKVFIVESPICAMTICQCGGNAVAICGTGNTGKLLQILKEKKPSCTLVLSLDNDMAGVMWTGKMINGYDNIAGLNELGIKYLVRNISGYLKDPNEAYLNNRYKFRKILNEVINE